DACEREDFVVAAQPGVAIDDDVRMQLAAVAQNHGLADHAVRTDVTIRPDLGFRMDDGGGMNHRDCGLGIASCELVRERAVFSEATTKARISFPSCSRLVSCDCFTLRESTSNSIQ